MSETNGKKENPPYSNTGGTGTLETDLRLCVDWVGVTFKNIFSFESVCDILMIDYSHFENLEKGGLGYRDSYSYNNIKIFEYGVNKDGSQNLEMGTHLEISGQGCREYEQMFKTGWDWQTFFALTLNWDVYFTRLDIANDDFKGYLDFKKIMNCIKAGAVKGKFKTARNYEQFLLSDGSTDGQTIYFGKSDVIFRFYDKKAERKAKNVFVTVDVWQRYEMQLRGDRAHSMAVMIASDFTDVGTMFYGVMKDYLTFLRKNHSDTKKSRWPVAKWWSDYLGEVEALGLVMKPYEPSISKSYNWLMNQVSTSLFKVYASLDFNDKLIHALLVEGQQRMSEKQSNQIYHFDNFERSIKYSMIDELNTKKDVNKTDKSLINVAEDIIF